MSARSFAGYIAVVVTALVTASGVVAARAAVASTEPGPTACQARVPSRLLPMWARSGFSSRRPSMPYVLGENGKIAAIQWADPLRSPASTRYNNKILWVSRRPQIPGSDLQITARRLVGDALVGPLVRRAVTGGAGPSIINLPAAGCWQLGLGWSGRHDMLDLRYVA
jgi:hypothetical protein